MRAATSPPRRTLILPVESQVRELDSKLLLACVAAERGFRVVLGSRERINRRAAFLPRGIYLAKSVAPSSVRMFGILRKLGHRITAWSEDGLVHAPPDSYYERRLSAEALREVSCFFAWGPENAELLERFPGYPGTPIEVTGNPRIDLLRPSCRPCFEAEAARIRREFGSYILINSSFGHLNHYSPKLGSERIALETAGGAGATAFSLGRAAHRRELFAHFQKLVPSLATAFPEHRIVVRPHPVESPAAWETAAAGYPNVSVVMEGNIIPWLLGATALVHNGCTTGFEAFLLRVPSVAYQPVVHERYDTGLPNFVSHRTFDFQALCDVLRDTIAGRSGPADDPDQWERAAWHVAGLEGPLASDRIVDVLERLDEGALPSHAPPAGGRLVGWIQANHRAVSKLLRFSGSPKNRRYQRHRFPGLATEEVQAHVRRFQDALGRFEGVQATGLAPDVYQIAG